MENRETGDTAKIAPDAEVQRGRIPADTFSIRLMLSRVLAGHLSIREACERTGLNRGNWQEWERGRRPHDQVEVSRVIAEGLDVDFTWLLLGGPLEGPRGRRVRPSAERSTPTILGYSPTAGRPIMGSDEHAGGGYSPAPNRPRPSTTRPTTTRKNVRPDRRPSNQGESDRTRRPVRVG